MEFVWVLKNGLGSFRGIPIPEVVGLCTQATLNQRKIHANYFHALLDSSFLIKNYVIKNLFAIPNHLNGDRDEWRGGSFLVE
jgi:hypothetical protein